MGTLISEDKSEESTAGQGKGRLQACEYTRLPLCWPGSEEGHHQCENREEIGYKNISSNKPW